MNEFQPADGSREKVTGTIKWFNASKGFGFVALSETGPDAFLHISVLQKAGLGEPDQGANVLCDLLEGPKGLQVAEIHHIDGGARPTTEQEGAVKFFNAAKGFGFVAPDDGSRDVFVCSSTLERCAVPDLAQGQRVKVVTRMGKKGPMADRIELISG